MKPALRAIVVWTVLMGIVYTLVVTGVAQLVFPRQANGSLIERDGVVIGSRLIGQPFHRPDYFWSRPSATGEQPYNGAGSQGSNLGPSNESLKAQLDERVAALRGAGHAEGPVPVDLVTASGSGLDPHISPAAALFQVERVAAARDLDAARLRELVRSRIEPRFLGILGESVVNVLALNLALDSLSPVAAARVP